MIDENTPAIGGEDPQYAVNTLAGGSALYRGSDDDFHVLLPQGDDCEVGSIH